ncbi:MAG: hypothetical protein ACRYGG_19400, partial [Janthinobacterium lividum]
MVTEDFTTGAFWNTSTVYTEFSLGAFSNGTQLEMLGKTIESKQQAAMTSSLLNLSRSDCKHAFSPNFVSQYSLLLFVARHGAPLITEANSSLLSYSQHDSIRSTNSVLIFNNTLTSLGYAYPIEAEWLQSEWSYAWEHAFDYSLGVPGNSLVDYCLVQSAPQQCTVVTLPAFQGFVVAFNAIKIVCLIIMLIESRDEPLMTIGDAVASFLTYPDLTTAAYESVNSIPRSRNFHRRRIHCWYWPSAASPWFSGASKTRWCLTSGLCIAYWIVGLAMVIKVGSTDWKALWSLGFSTNLPESRDTLQFFPSSRPIAQSVLMANVWQMALSFVYLCYNGIFTSMLLSREFTDFAWKRKGLRVSVPRGEQKRSHWLTLPYTFSVPLLVAASVLHWLLLEAIFLDEIQISSPLSEDLGTGWTGNSFSNVILNAEALFVLLVVGGFLILVMLGIGFRTYTSGIPIVRSDSLAISAACHPRSGKRREAYKKIMWGVVGEGPDGPTMGFTSDETMSHRKFQ